MEKTVIQSDTFSPMFISALFTAAKTQKQLKYPSTDEWVKNMGFIYIYIYTWFTVLYTCN